MQVPVIHRLNHFQVCSTSNSLQNQNLSFFSEITSSLAGIQSSSIAYNLCKWGALILALLATFRSIAKRVNVFIIRFRQNAPSLPSIPLLSDLHYEDDDDDGTCSSLSSEFEEDEDDALSDSDIQQTDEYFGVRGSVSHVDDQLQSGNGNGGFLRRRSLGDIFSLSEIANTKSVVKLWDTIGFGFDHSGSSAGSVITVYDVNEEQRLRPIPTGKPLTPAISCSSPEVVVSAGENSSGNLALKIWDTRLRRRWPAVIAEWGPSLGNAVGVESGGVQKVYVTDDGRYGLTVGDMRNVRSPLENVTESHLDTWWPNSFMLKM